MNRSTTVSPATTVSWTVRCIPVKAPPTAARSDDSNSASPWCSPRLPPYQARSSCQRSATRSMSPPLTTSSMNRRTTFSGLFAVTPRGSICCGVASARSVQRDSSSHRRSVSASVSAAVRAATSASDPSSSLTGGSSSSTRRRTASATRSGSPTGSTAPAAKSSASTPTVARYGSLAGGTCIDDPAQSVRIPPGSIAVTLMPSGPTSAASTSLRPLTAHLAAW
ncbi:hypothetical protein BJF78_00915 [Pseudonocardia sp. CNS-139]|nr:hypothetical protein BJF78_00915 [Pseudonocardia sp. CNS-139]